MPIGVLTDNAAVLLGGLLGGFLGPRMPESLKRNLNQLFGFAALGIGITLIVKVSSLGGVFLSLVLGTCLGTWLKLGERVNRFFTKLNAWMLKTTEPDEEYIGRFVPLLVLACCSGTGIFGSMNEGLTGDSTTILCKAILDFFTVMIFATELGKFCAVIAVPQMIIMLTLFFCARLIMPLMTPTLIGDFSAAGGIIQLIIALRILRLTTLNPVNALPALILVFPVSLGWNLIF